MPLLLYEGQVAIVTSKLYGRIGKHW